MSDVKIRMAKNVLSEELIQSVREQSHKQELHKVNLTAWPPLVVGVSGPILLFTVSDENKEQIKKAVEHLVNVRADDTTYTWHITYTLGGRLSYIPWHSDDIHEVACTIYLNDVWKRDWGGAFIYENEPDDIRAVYPKYNTAVVFSPPLRHCTVMPTLDAPLRESIQIFIGK